MYIGVERAIYLIVSVDLQVAGVGIYVARRFDERTGSAPRRVETSRFVSFCEHRACMHEANDFSRGLTLRAILMSPMPQIGLIPI